MIKIRNLVKTYGTGAQRQEVLHGLNLDIGTGEMVSIMGTSGSGKSTLLHIMGLLDNYDSGSYELNGLATQALSETKAAKLRNAHLGFIFQSFHLLPSRSALENVALPLYYQGLNKRARMEKADHLLERVGLGNRKHHLPGELSGGQKQRVAIARALATDPFVLLADEPTGALDSATAREVMTLLHEIHQQGKTIIMVTHERSLAHEADRVIEMKDGQILG